MDDKTAEGIVKFDELLEISRQPVDDESDVENFYWGTLAIVKFLYTPKSPQYRRLLKVKENYPKEKWDNYSFGILSMCGGVVKSAKYEIENGLLTSIAQQISSDIYSHMLALAKEASLKDIKSISGTLAAATIEDTLKA